MHTPETIEACVEEMGRVLPGLAEAFTREAQRPRPKLAPTPRPTSLAVVEFLDERTRELLRKVEREVTSLERAIVDAEAWAQEHWPGRAVLLRAQWALFATPEVSGDRT